MKKYKYLEPQAKKCINEAKRINADVIMMVVGFITDTEALNLRDMLWYACDNEVMVLMIPASKEKYPKKKLPIIYKK